MTDNLNRWAEQFTRLQRFASRDSAVPAADPASRWCDKAGKLVPAVMAQYCSCRPCVSLRRPLKARRA